MFVGHARKRRTFRVVAINAIEVLASRGWSTPIEIVVRLLAARLLPAFGAGVQLGNSPILTIPDSNPTRERGIASTIPRSRFGLLSNWGKFGTSEFGSCLTAPGQARRLTRPRDKGAASCQKNPALYFAGSTSTFSTVGRCPPYRACGRGSIFARWFVLRERWKQGSRKHENRCVERLA